VSTLIDEMQMEAANLRIQAATRSVASAKDALRARLDEFTANPDVDRRRQIDTLNAAEYELQSANDAKIALANKASSGIRRKRNA
jgi:hypothetical protein